MRYIIEQYCEDEELDFCWGFIKETRNRGEAERIANCLKAKGYKARIREEKI